MQYVELPDRGSNSMLPEVEVQHLNHWTIRGSVIVTLHTAGKSTQEAKPAPPPTPRSLLVQNQAHEGLSTLQPEASKPWLCPPGSHSCTRIPHATPIPTHTTPPAGVSVGQAASRGFLGKIYSSSSNAKQVFPRPLNSWKPVILTQVCQPLETVYKC